MRKSDTLSMVYALDVSDSMGEKISDKSMEWILKSVAQKPEKDEAGLVVFGRDRGDQEDYGHGDLLYGQGAPKEVYVLDISKLVAAGTSTTCSIDTLPEVSDGGHESECPTLASSTTVPMVGCGALAFRCPQRASFGTQKMLAARYSSGSSGSAP